MASVYILKDPINNQVRYVGKTNGKLSNRLSGHIYDARRSPRASVESMGGWINKLLDLGLKPLIITIDHDNEGMILIWEKKWIQFFQEYGCDLYNQPNFDIRMFQRKHMNGVH